MTDDISPELLTTLAPGHDDITPVTEGIRAWFLEQFFTDWPGRRELVARSYVREKLDFAYHCGQVWELFSLFDLPVRRAVFAKWQESPLREVIT